ncbi:hypothetical protein BJX61DRAFT_532611 [Aspergillus egyptiacus]|nr:hypothetical protein BJX61DRAFT_532611 [Aspergillus egyptiacus]
MKAALITVVAALATSVAAAPTQVPSDVSSVAQNLNMNLPAATPSPRVAAAPGYNGDLLQQVGKEVRDILEVTGPNAERLLIQLSPSIASLLAELGLPEVGHPVGEIIDKASSIGELLEKLGPHTENLLTVVSESGEYLLIKVSSSVAKLLNGAGLSGLADPVGNVVATVAKALKRDSVVGDVVPEARDILEVTGVNSERLLIQLSPQVASLFNGLDLPGLGQPIGEIVGNASLLGKLVHDLGIPVEQTLTVIGEGGKTLLIKLAPSVASLLVNLNLPGVPAGRIIATVAKAM